MNYFVGLDVHTRTSSYCILDRQGHLVKQGKVAGTWERLLKELEKIYRKLAKAEGDGAEPVMALAYEASCGYGVLHDRLLHLPGVQSITVAHPGHLRLIFRSKRKNDRVDAKKLALLLLLDQLPAIHVPQTDVRSWRRMIEYRQSLVRRRSATKCSLRSLLRGYGIVAPRGLWTNKGRTWLETVALPETMAELTRRQLLEELDQHEKHVAELEQELDRIARRQPAVHVLQSIPGVGPRTAEAVAAYIDDPHRFRRNKQIGAYFGLVPCQDASADVNRLGHITREGPATVRKLIVEATWQAIRRDPTVRAYFERLLQDRPERRKKALVGTAHHLLRAMLAMLKSGECWRGAA